MTDPPTLAALIRAAAGHMDDAGLFFGHGTDNAIDEACWAASFLFDLPPDFGDEALMRTVGHAARERFDGLIERRIATRKPLAYLIGRAWFAGLEFEISEDVLVPRSPLAEAIAEGFAPWVDIEKAGRLLDVGTGSGCIAVAAAVHWPQLQVDAVDISPQAVALARRNAERHGVADRVEVLESDLFDAVQERQYDVIVANLPYVPTASMAGLPAEYRHEPALGLEAGEDGLDLVRPLLAQAMGFLHDGGVAFVEVGEAAGALDEYLAAAGCPCIWLEFARGGEGVALIEKSDLAAARWGG